MKRTIVLFAIMALSMLYAQAQNTTTGHYFYNEERVDIPINTSSLLVYFNKAYITLDEINNAYTIKKEVILNEVKADSLLAFVIDMDGDDWNANVAELKSKQYVFDVEPVIGENGYTLVSNKFYVLLKSLSDTTLLKNMAEQTLATYEGAMLDNESSDLLWYCLSTNKNTFNALEMSIVYGESGLFENVDPGFIYTIKCNVPHPTDAMHTSQWSVYYSYPDLWAEPIYGAGVNVAVIDDGVDITHNEFDSLSVIASADYTGINVTYPAAVHGSHATKVAGVIFANHNRYDIAGIAPKANLINLSALNTNYLDPVQITTFDESNVLRIYSALSYAYTSNADIILCPWEFLNDTASAPFSYLINSIINSTLSSGRGGKGTVIIFSSGNSSSPTKPIPYPANSDDRIIVVGAANQSHNRYTLSCYGNKLDVVAPGENILTTSTDINGNHSIVSVSGTSVAAAHVAGLVALMLSVNPNLTLTQIDWILKTSAYKSPNYTFSTYSNHPTGTWNNELGYGEVTAQQAVTMARPNIVIKDNSSDNGVEPTALNTPFDSPSIEVIDVSTNAPATTVYPGGTFNVNVTVHNYDTVAYNINLTDVKLYYCTHLYGNMTWNSSFSGVTPITPISASSGPINSNGGSKTFVFQISLSPGIAPYYMNNNVYITFIAMLGYTGFIHNYGATNYPLDDFVAGNRLVAGKTFLHYEEPTQPFNPGVPKSIGINISPNPTSGKATIEVTSDDAISNATIIVTDMYGNRVMTDQLNGMSYMLNLEGKPSGTYYIFVVANNRLIGMNNIVLY